VEVTIEGNASNLIAPGLEAKPAEASSLQYTAPDESGSSTTSEVSRNSPCPCGSGKKYKRCHGAA